MAKKTSVPRAIRVPMDLDAKMRENKDVNWSQVCLRAIRAVVEKGEAENVDDLLDSIKIAQRKNGQ